MNLRAVAAIAVALCCAQSLHAQQPSSPATGSAPAQAAGPAAADSVQQAITAMASGLRNLVTAQEKYWMDHGSYTTDLAALGLYPASKGTRPPFLPQVLFAGGRGWSGIAVNHRLKKSCVIYVGWKDELPFVPRTQYDRIVASDEGAPACERP